MCACKRDGRGRTRAIRFVHIKRHVGYYSRQLSRQYVLRHTDPVDTDHVLGNDSLRLVLHYCAGYIVPGKNEKPLRSTSRRT